MNDQIVEYIRENRGRYTRQAIDDQLRAAGHPAQGIEAAWVAVGPPEGAEPALPGARYGPLVVGLLIVGGVATAIAGRDSFDTRLWVLSYLIAVLIVMGIGIGMTKVAAGSGWKAVVVLVGLLWAAILWITVSTLTPGGDATPPFIGAGIAAVATLTAFAVHRYHREVPLLVYALPVLGWLAVTGVCVSPLLIGT